MSRAASQARRGRAAAAISLLASQLIGQSPGYRPTGHRRPVGTWRLPSCDEPGVTRAGLVRAPPIEGGETAGRDWFRGDRGAAGPARNNAFCDAAFHGEFPDCYFLSRATVSPLCKNG